MTALTERQRLRHPHSCNSIPAHAPCLPCPVPQAATEAASQYEALRVVHDFCMGFDALAYRTGQRDVAQFRRDMAMLK